MFNLFNLKPKPQDSSREMSVEEEYKMLVEDPTLKTATLTGGCFWCMEGPFEQLEGVKEVIAGYSGGDFENPTYELVVTGQTDHREAVQIFYDPNLVSFKELLDIYWYQIDPTDEGGQFADRGHNYTTAIYYHDEEERQIAESAIAELDASGRLEGPVVTKIEPFKKFWPAEDYHQDFYQHSAERYERYEELSGRKGYKDSQKDN